MQTLADNRYHHHGYDDSTTSKRILSLDFLKRFHISSMVIVSCLLNHLFGFSKAAIAQTQCLIMVISNQFVIFEIG